MYPIEEIIHKAASYICPDIKIDSYVENYHMWLTGLDFHAITYGSEDLEFNFLLHECSEQTDVLRVLQKMISNFACIYCESKELEGESFNEAWTSFDKPFKVLRKRHPAPDSKLTISQQLRRAF